MNVAFEHAERKTEGGYVIEAALPFRSLRFPRADGQATWGAYLTRWWPRSSNVELRSAAWDRGNACVLCQANVLRAIRGVVVRTAVLQSETRSLDELRAELPGRALQLLKDKPVDAPERPQ